MSTEHDLIVIGAGMAGVTAATKCASRWEVAIVDALPFGGTCALRGCDPKKILRRGAEIIDAARLMDGKGIDRAGLAISWADLTRHKRGFTDRVPQTMQAGLSRARATTWHGEARFTGPGRVQIDGDDHRARHILVATGAAARPLEFPGHEHLIDSTQFLDLEALPARILFVGGAGSSPSNSPTSPPAPAPRRSSSTADRARCDPSTPTSYSSWSPGGPPPASRCVARRRSPR